MMAKAKENQPEKMADETDVASLVHGDGTDEEIREACERRVGGWEDLSARQQHEVIELMRTHHDLPTVPELQFDPQKSSSRIREGDNPTLQTTRLLRTLATQSQPLVNARLGDIVNFHHKTNGGKCAETDVNAHLAFVAGCQPKDPAQAALAVQMHATHEAAMRALAMIGQQTMVDQISSLGNLSTKLLNVYARQAEALAKLQRGAEQTVRHVYVDARTQTAYNYPPGQSEMKEQSHATEEFGNSSAMLGYDADGRGVPIASGQGEAPLPDARRDEPGRAKGK